MKPYGWEFRCFAGLALAPFAGINPFCSSAATAQISPNSCSTTPSTIPNLFDPDLADLKAVNNQYLDSTSQAMKGANKSSDRGCYPTSATITVFSPPFRYPGHPEVPETFLGDRRTDALIEYFKAKGLVLKTDFDISLILGQGDKVEVRFNGVDRDPPILKTNSKPPKGTKVKKGDRIEVHATASERYEDGHKSWPSGVKSIQLIANGILFKSEDYGMKPPPCEVRHFDPVYTVPSNPPPVVHLRVFAEDAVGHDTFEEADFPTSDWYGSFTWSGRAPVPSGPQDWDGHADLALDDDGKGALTGTLVGTQTQKLGLAKCHAFTQGTLSAALTGTISVQRITINVPNGQSNWPAKTPCAEGLSAGTGAPVFQWPHLGDAFRGLTASADGSLHFDQQWTFPAGPYTNTVHYTLTLRRAAH